EIPQRVVQSSSSNRKTVCSWKPPPIGFLKLNVDGAMIFSQHKVGVGVILKDERGSVIMVANKIENEVDLETVELVAMFGGLQFYLQLGISRLILVSDCLVLINELQRPAALSLSKVGNLLKEAQTLMTRFSVCNCQHVNRSGNEATHKLDCLAWNIDDIVIWGTMYHSLFPHLFGLIRIPCNSVI
ncbi:hypothetical protein F2P56_001946, partial [Juglans regia]